MLPCAGFSDFLLVPINDFPEILAFDESWFSVSFMGFVLVVTGKDSQPVERRIRDTSKPPAIAALYGVQLVVRNIPEV